MKPKNLKRIIKASKAPIFYWANCAWDSAEIVQDGIYLRITKKQAYEIIQGSESVPVDVREDGTIYIN